MVGQSGCKLRKVEQKHPKSTEKAKGGAQLNLLGEYRHTLDSKNRLFIPAKFREILGDEFVVTRKTDTCLAIYPPEKWKALSDKLNSFPDSKVGPIKRFIFSKSESCTPDSNGRIVLKPAGVSPDEDKACVIVGMGDHAEIWSASLYEAQEASINMDDMKSMLLELGL